MPATPPRAKLPSRPLHTLPARRAAQVGAFLLAGVVGGCGPADDKFPPVCPGLSLLRDGGDLTRFAADGRDVTDMVMRARIVGVPAKCETVSGRKIRATLTVQADVTRGPAARDRSPSATYFVAVTDGDKILQEQDFPLVATFPSNVDRIGVSSDDIELLFPVTKEKSAAAYHIYVGFRLTPEELTYNRTHRMP